jgi:hypothetical protein
LKSLTQAIEHLRQSQISAPDSIFNTHACSQFQRLLMVDDETRRAMYQDQVLESLKFDEMHQRFDAVHSAHEDTFKWIYEPIETIEEDDDLSLEDDNWSNVEEHGLTYEERIRREALKVLAETLHQRAELTVVRSADATQIKTEILRVALIRRDIIASFPHFRKVGIWKINTDEVSMLSSEDRRVTNEVGW